MESELPAVFNKGRSAMWLIKALSAHDHILGQNC